MAVWGIPDFSDDDAARAVLAAIRMQQELVHLNLEREAAGKWTRAQLTSAQLSTYFVGYLEHAQLRREAEAACGDRFDLKTYHDRLLSFGSPPVRYARALMLDEEIPH